MATAADAVAAMGSVVQGLADGDSPRAMPPSSLP
jgi:hypothetical protein